MMPPLAEVAPQPLLRRVTPSTWDAATMLLALYCLAHAVGMDHLLLTGINAILP